MKKIFYKLQSETNKNFLACLVYELWLNNGNYESRLSAILGNKPFFSFEDRFSSLVNQFSKNTRGLQRIFYKLQSKTDCNLVAYYVKKLELKL